MLQLGSRPDVICLLPHLFAFSQYLFHNLQGDVTVELKHKLIQLSTDLIDLTTPNVNNLFKLLDQIGVL